MKNQKWMAVLIAAGLCAGAGNPPPVDWNGGVGLNQM